MSTPFTHTHESSKPNALLSILTNKCPRCRRGHLFVQPNAYKLKGFMLMNEHCPICGQATDMEPGFYYGTSYVSYVLAVAISVSTFIAWWVLIGFSFHDNRFFWWMGINAVILVCLQPPLMRLSRTIWLYFFVHYSAHWKEGDLVKLTYPAAIGRNFSELLRVTDALRLSAKHGISLAVPTPLTSS